MQGRWGVLLLLVLTSCDSSCGGQAREDVQPATVVYSWPSGTVIEMVLSEDLTLCERAALDAAVAWWKTMLDRPVAWMRAVPANHMLLSIPERGQVAVTHEPVSRPETLAEYHPFITEGKLMHSGEIRLNGCDVFRTVHEVGHALGLGHSNAGLMRKERSGDWRIHDNDLRALRWSQSL